MACQATEFSELRDFSYFPFSVSLYYFILLKGQHSSLLFKVQSPIDSLKKHFFLYPSKLNCLICPHYVYHEKTGIKQRKVGFVTILYTHPQPERKGFTNCSQSY